MKKEEKGPSHLRIYNQILRSKEFGQFILAKEAAVWFHLCGWVIRGKMNSCGLAKKLYEDFYLGQRKLVARWDQDMIAEHIGLSKKSKGYVSTLLTKLEKDWNAIKIIKIPSYKSHYINVYELGYIDEDEHEVLYLMGELSKRNADEMLVDMGVQSSDADNFYTL